MSVNAANAVEVTAESRRASATWVWVWALPVLGLLAGSYWLNHLGVDLQVQRAIYSVQHGWTVGEQLPWRFLYHFGTLPAMLAVVWALVGLVLKLGRRLPAELNFATLYLALVLAIGPGVVANLILKEHWGRPRPREVVEFGGRHAYEPPLWRDASSTGKSFPCGHATMGFFFFAHFFIHRDRRPGLAWLAFGTALVLGWLIGVARAMQGGHFITDTWWAMGVMWFTAAGLWQLTHHMERRRWFAQGFQWLLAHPRTGTALVATTILLAAVGALLATPYQREQDVAAKSLPADRELKFTGIFQEGELDLYEAPEASFKVSANGHGMVWSKVLSGVRQKEDEGLFETRFLQTRKGWFTELNQEMKLRFPMSRAREVQLTLTGTDVAATLPAVTAAQTWKVMGHGVLELQVPANANVTLQAGMEIQLKNMEAAGFAQMAPGKWLKKGEGPVIKLMIAMEKGAVVLHPHVQGAVLDASK